jgi:hypothetical protein
MAGFKIPEFVYERIDLGRFVALQMIDALVKNPETMIGLHRPIADPGRELIVSGDLDAVIASGLGIDLEALHKISDQVGIVAALAKAEVSIANKSGNIEFDEPAVAGLRNALNAELNSTLNVAAPQDVRATRSRGQGAAAALPPDALDALIEGADFQAGPDEEDI